MTAPGEAVWNLTPISTEFGSLGVGSGVGVGVAEPAKETWLEAVLFWAEELWAVTTK